MTKQQISHKKTTYTKLYVETCSQNSDDSPCRKDRVFEILRFLLLVVKDTFLYLLKIIIGAIILLAILYTVEFGLHYHFQKSHLDREPVIDQQKKLSTPRCDNIPVIQRTDCWPQGGASQQSCANKGCCWDPSIGLGGAPTCFYPTNYQGYFVQSFKQTPTGMSYTLIRNTSSGWPDDVKTLQLDVMYETQTRLHFKIYDPANKRYEVPVEVSPGEGRIPSQTDYEVDIPTSGAFSMKVTRTFYGDLLFNSDAAPLIFADQFLQLGSILETHFIYGLGEHRSQYMLSTNWTKLVLWTRDQPPMPDYNLYGHHPFYLNVEPSHFAHGVFLLNSNAMGVELQPFPAVTFRTTGGVLDFYIFTGPTADNVIQQYTELIGRPFMPPYWSLGFNLCRWGYGGTRGLRKVIDRMRAAKMPYDTQWNDIDYMHQFLDWTYNSTGDYSDLPQLVDDLHAHGQHYVLIIDPGISNTQPAGTYPPYDEGLKNDIFIKNSNGSGPIVGVVWPGNTVFPDFFHPNATQYWTNQAQSYFSEVKFDGLWIDMNEPSNFYDGSVSGCPDNSLENPPFVPPGLDGGKLRSRTLCASAKQFLSSHYNLHSLYGYSETKSSMSALMNLRPNKRSIVISRSTFPGSGVYGGHWLGDNNAEWEDLAYSIPGILSFQLFGISMVGADICGFFGDTNPELCTRWMQLGSFYPFMRNHNAIGFQDQDPASFDEATQRIMRTTLELRYSLLPFFYTQFYRSHVDGTPVIRPIFFQYPINEDDAIYSLDKQFMWGTSLLITPALSAGMRMAEGYLPEDRWYDFYNHSYVDSPGKFTMFDVPLEHINIQVRGGTIFPMQEPNVTTTISRKNRFIIYAALNHAGSAYGELFWDDGESLDAIGLRKFNLIEFYVNKRMLNVYVAHGGYTEEPMIVGTVYVLGVEIGPTSVVVNGETTAQYTYKNKTLTVFGLNTDLLKHLDIAWLI